MGDRLVSHVKILGGRDGLSCGLGEHINDFGVRWAFCQTLALPLLAMGLWAKPFTFFCLSLLSFFNKYSLSPYCICGKKRIGQTALTEWLLWFSEAELEAFPQDQVGKALLHVEIR